MKIPSPTIAFRSVAPASSRAFSSSAPSLYLGYHYQPSAGSHTKRKYDTNLPTIHQLGPSHHRSYTSTTSLKAGNPISDIVSYIPPISQLVVPFASIVTLILGGLYWKYRGAINYRLKLLREESWIFGAGVTMERIDIDKEYIANGDEKKTKIANNMVDKGEMFSNLRLLELNPDFQQDCAKKGWQVYSLGDYMSSLRPKQLPKNMDMDFLPNLIQREVEAGLAAALLKALGPNLGRALLPVTGLGPIQNKVTTLASNVVTKWFLSEQGGMLNDKGGVPIALLTLLAASDLNSRLNSGKDTNVPINPTGFSNMQLSAIEKMMAGEVVKGPSYIDGDNKSIVPQKKFIVSRDFDRAISEMEQMLSKQLHASGQTDTGLQMAKMEVTPPNGDNDKAGGIVQGDNANGSTDTFGGYDPDDQRLEEPVPINPRLFPGLHLGYGKAICSHTKREVLKMRLIAILLNRLGSNYYKRLHGLDDQIFSVQMSENSTPITKPWEFVQALIDNGHKVEMVPTTHLTTFGVNLCVKEKDGSWSNIPLAVFLESGYEDTHGRVAPAMMPHSGLDMYITGPLTGTRKDGTPSTLQLQHFHGIEGFCGWHSNEHPVVPFNIAVETGSRLSNDDAVRAARIAGLYANVLNGLSTELKLPFGGYGLTAVCNDSAALVQQCLYDESTIYPMTSVGRFLHRAMRYSQHMADQTSRLDNMEAETHDLMAIADAMKKIPSDINASPGNAESAARRMLATTQPNLPFLLAKESKAVMEEILKEEQEAKVKERVRSDKLATQTWQ